MEPVQRLIIGNNVYDANDDELESEVTPYLNNLIQKQKTAKDGKAAIITATQNKTGKPITTNTYAEVVDKINEIKSGSFNVHDLSFGSKFARYVPDYYQEIIDNKIVRFNNWETLTDVGSIAFYSKYTRDILHRPPNIAVGAKLSIQVNLDFSHAPADMTPIFTVFSDDYPDSRNIAIAKLDDYNIAIQYVNKYSDREYDEVPVLNMSNFNYFGVDIICLENENRITINMYGGVRQESETSMSGYIPSNKKLLFSKTLESKFNADVLVPDSIINVAVCGSHYPIKGADEFAQTALHIQDFGVRLADPYTTSVVGNTNFLDMEVTS